MNNLREVKLIAKEDPNRQDTLDCHPLIREYFGEKLKISNPAAWKEANSRMYEYYKSHAKEFPDTIEEMTPLYLAVAHGCQAGHYREALKEVYRGRIQKMNQFFASKNLGAMSSLLTILSGFFDKPWSQPALNLIEIHKSYVLSEAGFYLRALGRMKEAIEPMKAVWDADITREDWKNASRSASNLSELYLTMGDIAMALNHAKQGFELADKSGDAFELMITSTILADALHHAGSMIESEHHLKEAEEIRKKERPEYPLLYSLWGFRYCDLLLSKGKYTDVLRRAEQTLNLGEGEGWYDLLSIALDHLSLGRAHLLQARQKSMGDLSQAAEHLNLAVDGLRRAGLQDELPRGLLSRSELHLARRDFHKARRDMDEAMIIAERGSMGLHRADCHLGYARLYLAMGDKEKARENFAKAKEMIEKMGYHRRDGEVKKLEEQLSTK